MSILHCLVLLGCLFAPSLGQFTNGRFAPPRPMFGGRSLFGGFMRNPIDRFFDDPQPLLNALRSNFNFATCQFTKNTSASGMGGVSFGSGGLSSFGQSPSGEVTGRIDMRENRRTRGSGVTLQIKVNNLPMLQNGQSSRAMNVLEYGDCSNAGPHFDPRGRGVPHSTIRQGMPIGNGHVGDLGNFEQYGTTIDLERQGYTGFSIGLETTRSIIGRSIVITMGEDQGGAINRVDGNAGPPIACCTVAIANGEAFIPNFDNRNQQPFGRQNQWSQNPNQNPNQNQGPWTGGNTATGNGFNQGSGTGFNQGSGNAFNQGSGTGFNQGSGNAFNQGTSNSGGSASPFTGF